METKRPTHPELVAALAKPGLAILLSLLPPPPVHFTTEDMSQFTTFAKEGAAKCHLWHMGSALVGEAAELMEGIYAYGESGDSENVLEELGDIEFYAEGIRAPLGLQLTFMPDDGYSMRSRAYLELDARDTVIDAARVFDALKKHVIYNKELDVAKLLAPLQKLHNNMARVRYHFKWTREQVLEANITKLLKRYAEMTYTDTAAQVRADKVEGDYAEAEKRVIANLSNGMSIEVSAKRLDGHVVGLSTTPTSSEPMLHQEALTGRHPVMPAAVQMASELGKDACDALTAQAQELNMGYNTTESLVEFRVGVTRTTSAQKEFKVHASNPEKAKGYALTKAANAEWGSGEADYEAHQPMRR